MNEEAVDEEPGSAYLPKPEPERRGVALCLSGGGYRAALFHLGALRRLNELGVLSQADTISSVSGGSILAAHLAHAIGAWSEPGRPVEGWDERVAAPFRAFTKKNIRTWPIFKRLLPWNWLRTSTAVRALAATYQRRLTPLVLTALPEHPRFVFCATDMAFGVNFVFDSGGRRFDSRAGDYQAGYARPLPPWPVALAVAASSCFPPIFDPLPLGFDPRQLREGKYREADRDRLVAGIRLSDGGVYDNLGLEPVWKDHTVVLVSDGGALFEAEPDTGMLWRMKRYQAIVGRGGAAMRKRWLISNFKSKLMRGAYWGIGSVAGHYPSPSHGYSEGLVDDIISEIRTDLDAFSDAEAEVLQNHGYLLADAAIRGHAADLIAAPSIPPASFPYERWADESAVRDALRDSHKRKLLGRW
jgi:NTE family protein